LSLLLQDENKLMIDEAMHRLFFYNHLNIFLKLLM
jgi:hypothetical protein